MPRASRLALRSSIKRTHAALYKRDVELNYPIWRLESHTPTYARHVRRHLDKGHSINRNECCHLGVRPWRLTMKELHIAKSLCNFDQAPGSPCPVLGSFPEGIVGTEHGLARSLYYGANRLPTYHTLRQCRLRDGFEDSLCAVRRMTRPSSVRQFPPTPVRWRPSPGQGGPVAREGLHLAEWAGRAELSRGAHDVRRSIHHTLRTH
jgi:hypothetical protein